MVKVISLDFGGTIAYELEEDYMAYHRLLKELGYLTDLNLVEKALEEARDWWREERARTGRIWNMDVYLELIERVLRTLKLPVEIASDFLKILPHRVELGVYEDVELTLRELKDRGYRLIVISNVSSVDNLSIYLSRVGLRDYFEFLIASGTVGFEKPDSRIFELALKKAGVSPEEIVHVGDDYEADYLGAENTGLIGVLLDRRNIHGDKQCRRIIELTELPDLLASFT